MKRTPAMNRPFVESYAEKAGLLKQKKTRAPRLYYLSGAVTHDPNAKLKFDLAEVYLKSKGHQVINPLRINPIGTPWEKAIANDLRILNWMKDYYFAVLQFAKFMDEDKLYLPAIADIDTDDPAHQYDSAGKRLEKAIAFDVIPIVKLADPWKDLLMDAINENGVY